MVGDNWIRLVAEFSDNYQKIGENARFNLPQFTNKLATHTHHLNLHPTNN